MTAVLVLDRTALCAVLLLPLLLLHAHGIAEVAVGVADCCFLARSALRHDWGWLHTRWLRIGGAWWIWLVICSLPLPALGLGEGGLNSTVQAVVTVRFLLFVAALEHAVLRDAMARRWLYGLLAAAVIYIEAQSLLQWLTGRNLYGAKIAWGTVLTGPFDKARAAAPLTRLLLPVVVPVLARLYARPSITAKLGGGALLLLALAILMLISQTVPVLQAVFGLAVAGLLLPRLRPALLAIAAGVCILIPGLIVISPPTYTHLVVRATGIIEDFPTSAYGELYTRAFEIGLRNPTTGLGFEGFGTGCPEPIYFRPTFDHKVSNGGGAAICWDHPHNIYLEALDDSGVIGLVLFSALALAWLAPLARGLWHQPYPLRVGLFATIFVHLWPVQSSTAFTSMPLGGWFFLLLGWALAESRAAVDPHDRRCVHAEPARTSVAA